MEQLTHEPLAREEHIAPGSERSFALVMVSALVLFALLNWWHDGDVWPWLVATAAFFAVAGLCWPATLKPLNLVWFKLGLLLHKLVNPIIMGLIFYGAVLPTGLVLKGLGKDPLRLKLEPDRDSYWTIRQPPGPAPESMKDQF
jgi:hypothetical protein